MTDAPDPMAEIRASFFVECEELLEAMQDGLQQIEDGGSDAETINVVFRAVHSIKGGAGAFGLETLVRFAHRYETVMDVVRTGVLDVDGDILKLFFRCADHLSDLVRCCRDDDIVPVDQGNQLIDLLDSAIGASGPNEEPDVQIDFQPMGLNIILDLDNDDADVTVALDLPVFHIHFVPHADLFETGNEPFKILNALQELGLCEITCNTGKLVPLEQMVPETPYLSWDIVLNTNVDQAEILSVFEFVDGLCDCRSPE